MFTFYKALMLCLSLPRSTHKERSPLGTELSKTVRIRNATKEGAGVEAGKAATDMMELSGIEQPVPSLILTKSPMTKQDKMSARHSLVRSHQKKIQSGLL